jgi:hypothetical protein
MMARAIMITLFSCRIHGQVRQRNSNKNRCAICHPPSLTPVEVVREKERLRVVSEIAAWLSDDPSCAAEPLRELAATIKYRWGQPSEPAGVPAPALHADA